MSPKLETDKEWVVLAVESGDASAWFLELGPKEDVIVRTDNYDRMWGLAPGRHLTREDWLRHIHPTDRAGMDAKVQALVDGRENTYEAEYRIIGDDGKVRWSHARGKSLREESTGKVIGVAGVSRDITESKFLKQSHEHFVAALSHDLRNPLTAARGNAELLLKFPDRIGEREVLLAKIIKAIERVERIIQDLLDGARLQSGQTMHLSYRECDLAAVMKDAIDDLTLQYGKRFPLELSGDLRGYWPSDALWRVLENLASNAVKYGAKHVPIHVRLSRSGSFVTLSVHNEGEPIPMESQAHIGFGIGLSIVHSIAEQLRGRMTIESGLSTGTTFTVEFPVRSANAAGMAG